MLAPLGQDQAGLRTVGNRNQHRGLAMLAFMALGQVARQQVAGRFAGKRQGDALDQAHGTSGKKAPPDQTPAGF